MALVRDDDMCPGLLNKAEMCQVEIFPPLNRRTLDLDEVRKESGLSDSASGQVDPYRVGGKPDALDRDHITPVIGKSRAVEVVVRIHMDSQDTESVLNAC